MESVKILDIRFDKITLSEALKMSEQFLYSSSQHTIFTPNPEFLVKAYKDDYFKKVLNTSGLNICDGKGIQVMSCVKLERITGVDFMMELCALAEKINKKVYLLGTGNDEVVKKAAEVLKGTFSNLIIAGYHKGIEIKEVKNDNKASLELDSSQNEELLSTIRSLNPDILFVAFGMGKQEKWIFENFKKMPSVKIAMGIGGAFEFISGTIPRAPLWMRKIGLEWGYRLIKEPRRIKRIWNATIVFPWLVFKTKSKKNSLS